MSWTTFTISTPRRTAFVDITEQAAEAAAASGREEGVLTLYCPHTTAGLMINENADPDVLHDLGLVYDRLVPPDPAFRHGEGNSDAHAKSSLVGVTLQVPLAGGRLALGTWQGIFFCEFDGPRERRVKVRVGP